MNSSIGPNTTPNNSIPWNVAMDRLKFQKRTCKTFIPKEIDNKCCVCNYIHSESEVLQSNETWNWKKHTKVEDSNCYGLLSPSNSAYLRCDIETEMEQICYVLLGVWRIAVPGLIMQMIGDADSTPNIKLEKELLQGISDAAVASDAWIITTGYKEESISELIGEVVFNSRIRNPEINFSAIAVGKWGNINDCHKLEDIRNSTNQSTVRKGYGQYKLETNHTHYVFFDDGTCNSLDNGKFASNLARKLSRGARRKIPLITIIVGGTLRALPSIYNNLKKQIPIAIVNGSGPFADILCKYFKLTEAFYKSSKNVGQKITNEEEASSDEEDNADIVMIDENFLEDNADAEVINETEPQDNADTEVIAETQSQDEQDDTESAASPPKFTLRQALRPLGKNRREFVNDVRKLYNIIRQQEYDAQGKRLPVGELLNFDEEKAFGEYLYRFACCLKTPLREHIHVFDINSSNSLKETIYYAFVQARNNLSKMKKSHTNTDEQVHLALRWSIGQTTENQSVSTAKIWNDADKIEQNRSLLIDALSKNLLLFVANFVKLDIDFAVLFGPVRDSSVKSATHWSSNRYYLKELYSYTKRKNRDPLYLLDHISTNLSFTEEKHLIIVLKKLIGDIMEPFYEDQSKVGFILLKLRSLESEVTDAEYIYRDIFLWCILTYRLDMAKIFLSQMKTRICSSLIASKILKSLALYAPDQAAKDTLYAKADDFETYAIEFVRCSYCYDKHQACELIMRRIDLYGGVTCLQMAFTADSKKFLHEDACQALLTNIWYDKVDPVREQNRLIINILTLGISQIFISIYQKRFYTNPKIEQSNYVIPTARPQRRLKKNGIDYTDDYDVNETVLDNFLHFHNRPIVKYCYSCFGYILFLCFFSYFMLSAFNPPLKTIPSIHWTEILTIVIVTTMLFEEFREFFSQDDRSFMGKIRSYFDLNNQISNLFLIVPSHLLFYIGLVLRFTLTEPDSFVFARIVMAIDLELWFIRSVLFLGIAPELGPKLVMIRQMTNDLLLFIIIIIIFIFGYGITSRAMISYTSTGFNGTTFFRDVIYPVYYFVLGSFDNERTQLDATQNVHTALATHVVFALHMLFVNILLINLLIALFSFKINDVQTKARYVWAYDRCGIIRNYHARPALFPPFTFVILMIQCCQWCWNALYRNRCKKIKNSDNQLNFFKMLPMNDTIDRAWSEFERYSTNDYIRQLLDAQLATLAKGITTDIISESSSTNLDESRRIKSLITDLKEELDDSQSGIDNRLESMESNMTNLQTRLTQIETRFDRWTTDVKQLKKSLNWMMAAMAEAKLTQTEPPLIEDPPSRSNSASRQQQQSDTKYSRSAQRSTIQRTTMDKSQLNRRQSSKIDVRTETGNETND